LQISYSLYSLLTSQQLSLLEKRSIFFPLSSTIPFATNLSPFPSPSRKDLSDRPLLPLHIQFRNKIIEHYTDTPTNYFHRHILSNIFQKHHFLIPYHRTSLCLRNFLYICFSSSIYSLCFW
jgi:hypothetical protein